MPGISWADGNKWLVQAPAPAAGEEDEGDQGVEDMQEESASETGVGDSTTPAAPTGSPTQKPQVVKPTSDTPLQKATINRVIYARV